MASFRRSLSPSLIHERSLTLMQNGSSPEQSSIAFHEVVMPPSLCPLQRTAVLEKPAAMKAKSGQQSWKRPFLHTILCFFLGFLIGLSPLSWPGDKLGLHGRRGLYIYDASAKELQGIRDDLHTLSTVRAESAMRALSTANSAANSASNSANFASNSAIKYTTNSTPDSVSNSALDSTSDSAASSGFSSASNSNSSPAPLLIVITPTYNRASQALCLTRLSQTLRLVPPPLLWLVVESGEQSMETAALLRKTGVMYRHLVSENNATSGAARGVHQRNVALAHIQQHQLDGIVYFADDDNVYTLELFEHMRKIRRFGTWPVGMLTHDKAKAILEGPVCDGEKVIGWHTNEKSKRLRRFHVDMSGFAFNSTILWDPLRWGRHTLEPIRQLDNIKEGFQETTFIEQVVEDESQMEGLPSGCSRVMIWHLHLDQEGEATPHLAYPSGWSLQQSLNVTMPLRHF